MELRVEEVVPARDRALREDDHPLARLECGLGITQRPARPAAAIDRDATDGASDHPDDRCVEDLLLAEEAHWSPDIPGHKSQRGHVEVAPVVRGEQDRSA